MCSVHVTERKKYQREYIRENVQHIARGKMYGRKYATYPVFACMYEKEREKVQRTEYDGKRNGEEGKKYQGSGSKVFQPHECFLSPMLSQRGEKGAARRAINKNLYRELHIPRDAYRCIFVFLIGNVSRGEAYNIFTYSGNIDISLLISPCFWHWYFSCNTT